MLKPMTLDFNFRPSRHGVRDMSPLSMTDLERELLSHYIAHTAQTIPFDAAGLSALQIGIPGLALQSRPVMCSLLALAAACKCVDLLNENLDHPDMRKTVSELLEFAETRHQESVRLIQNVIHDAGQSSYVLANAAMMVCFAPASHCINIRLSQITPLTMPRTPSDGLRYVLLTRAPYLAFEGLTFRQDSAQSEISDHESNVEQYPEDTPAGGEAHASANTMANAYNEQCHALFPVLRATYGAALSELRARSSSALEFGQLCGGPGGFCECDRCSCASAMDLLSAIFRDVFADSNQAGTARSKVLPDSNAGDLAPWLRRFVQNAVSASGVRPLRYTILNFVQRAPTGFIELLRRELGDESPSSPTDLVLAVFAPPLCEDIVVTMALNIFAHWLVLLLLLDEVWWIGPIGKFELDRLTKRMVEVHSSELGGDGQPTDWWPGRMDAMYKMLHTG
ncbi:hypothetical protein B0A48_06868 [Cryoendolithus antarcticus]|uniref:C6 transcription factor n=1 Tax=Cryoendolithus antarcticus TaxID=1507870 RepID=A0A1V8T9W9_9PEZI|nr:hypothetical protein B0A48_06868 [Cryoendolithus antarcticus]